MPTPSCSTFNSSNEKAVWHASLERAQTLLHILNKQRFWNQHPSIYAKAEIASETAQACLFGAIWRGRTYFQRAEAFLNSINAISVTDATVDLLLHYTRMREPERGLEIVSG